MPYFYGLNNLPLDHNFYECTNVDCKSDGTYVHKDNEKQSWICRYCGRAHEGDQPHKLGEFARYRVDGALGGP